MNQSGTKALSTVGRILTCKLIWYTVTDLAQRFAFLHS